jgi:hypothetical protein
MKIIRGEKDGKNSRWKVMNGIMMVDEKDDKKWKNEEEW